MGKRIKEDFYLKVLRTIQEYKMLDEGDKIVVGVSGGPDSICLLDILLKIKQQGCQRGRTFLATKKSCQKGTSPLATLAINFDFVVAHLNHMIRKEANEDERFVKEYCEKNHIQFYSKSIDVIKIANNNKISTEEAGRNARYAFFDEILLEIGGNKIAIAHNKNDKVETILMNALRGCGISGLKGIESIRDKYIRPLIECERKEIEQYCEENNLQPRIDKTNFENVYTRNKIRNIVIPYIQKEFNPNFIETMDRLSKLVSEEETYIQNQVFKVYKEVVIEENQQFIILDLKKFNNQEKVIKSNVLLYTITRLFHTSKGIERIHIEDIIKLCANNVGNKFLMPNKNLKVFIKKGKIKISKETE